MQRMSRLMFGAYSVVSLLERVFAYIWLEQVWLPYGHWTHGADSPEQSKYLEPLNEVEKKLKDQWSESLFWGNSCKPVVLILQDTRKGTETWNSSHKYQRPPFWNQQTNTDSPLIWRLLLVHQCLISITYSWTKNNTKCIFEILHCLKVKTCFLACSHSLSLVVSLAVLFSLNNPWETEDNKDKWLWPFKNKCQTSPSSEQRLHRGVHVSCSPLAAALT